jgi:hypothetical protein
MTEMRKLRHENVKTPDSRKPRTRRKLIMYYVAREREIDGSTVIRATTDWDEHSQNVIMPLIEVEAYDAAEAREIFKRYLKRWLRNGRVERMRIRNIALS